MSLSRIIHHSQKAGGRTNNIQIVPASSVMLNGVANGTTIVSLLLHPNSEKQMCKVRYNKD